MILTEIIDIDRSIVDPARDQSVPKLKDLRKTKLTLAQINRLRMMRDVRQLEKQQRLGQVQDQYSIASRSQ